MHPWRFAEEAVGGDEGNEMLKPKWLLTPVVDLHIAVIIGRSVDKRAEPLDDLGHSDVAIVADAYEHGQSFLRLATRSRWNGKTTPSGFLHA